MICLSAHLSITLPISESGIPFTAQSLMVFVIAGIVNTSEFRLIILTYLFLGVLGLPIFADGTSGIDKIIGSSGGFLYGFLFSGIFIGSMIAYFKPIKLYHLLCIFFLATFVLFAFGIGHLSIKFGFEKALEYGWFPFWKMGFFKAFLATLIVSLVKRYVLV